MNKLITKFKQIHDPIHGYIKLSNIACKIVDNYYFQRLRYLHQLGTCFYVFPSATHSRFEHSLGTYCLTGRILDSIIKNTDANYLNECLLQVDELKNYYQRTYGDNNNVEYNKLDNYVCELIKIAGLCHDLGHGPFSHVFDDLFLKLHNEITPSKQHETRSGDIIQLIINSDPELSHFFTNDEIKFIKNLINPIDSSIGFVYQFLYIDRMENNCKK